MSSRRLRLWFVAALAPGVIPDMLAAQCPDGSPPGTRGCPGRVRIDTNAILILPFSVSGAPGTAYLGRGMVDLFHMALNGVGRVRIEYAPGLLDRVISGVDPTSVERAAGGAVELGIGRVIGGSIVAVGPDIRIRAVMFDAERNRQQFEVSARARIESVGEVVDSMAAQILARRSVPASERNRLRIGEYATRSPKALQAYLVGRQHVRAFERRQAAESLKSALAHDPDFGLAYVLLHRLESSQGGVSGIARDSIELMARARRDRFPQRVQDIFADTRFGNRVVRRAWLATLVQRYPNDPDVAFYNADYYFHHGINLGESHQAALQAFRRAYELDDEDPELVGHYTGLLLEVGDSASVRALEDAECRRRRRTDCTPDVVYRATFRGEDPLTMNLRGDTLIGAQMDNWIIRAVAHDPARGLALADSFAQRQLALTRPPNLRSAAWIVRSNVALARGQYARAGAWLDSANALVPRPGFVLLHHIVTGAREAEATRVSQGTIPSGNIVAVARAWWAAATQPADVAASYLPAIDQPREPVATRGMMAGLRGLAALRAGDTARALQLFEAMRPDRFNPTVPGRLLFPGSYLALEHARLEARRGNVALARTYLADVYPINEYVPFIGDAEELRAEVALALGDTASARKHLQNVVSVWCCADPPLQPRVARARETLARLR